MVLWYYLSMAFDLGFLPEADEDMNRIEADLFQTIENSQANFRLREIVQSTQRISDVFVSRETVEECGTPRALQMPE